MPTYLYSFIYFCLKIQLGRNLQWTKAQVAYFLYFMYKQLRVVLSSHQYNAKPANGGKITAYFQSWVYCFLTPTCAGLLER